MIFFGKYFWWAHGGSTWGADIDGGYRPVYGVIAATRLMFIKKFSVPLFLPLLIYFYSIAFPFCFLEDKFGHCSWQIGNRNCIVFISFTVDYEDIVTNNICNVLSQSIVKGKSLPKRKVC